MKKTLYAFIVILTIASLGYVLTPSDKLFDLMFNVERSMSNLTLKTTNISEGKIAYLESENNDLPILLLLHGFAANKDHWTRMTRHLSDEYHVIAPDLPGFGESYKNKDLDYGIYAQVKRIHELTKKLNLTHFHIAGNSLGGLIAGNYAAKYPDEIKTLWLLNPLGVVSAPDSEMFEMIKNNHSPKILPKNLKEYNELIDFAFYNKPFIPGVVTQNLAQESIKNHTLNSKIYVDIHRAYNLETHSKLALEKVLINFDKPVLITWGDKDRLLHPQGAEILSNILTNAHVNMLNDVGHLPMLETPKETAEVFLQFIESSI
jgi:pimeloyl-ACP methyl ester carboxylesterase